MKESRDEGGERKRWREVEVGMNSRLKNGQENDEERNDGRRR